MASAASASPQPSIAALVASHLPLLRRYARALSGTQAGGDAQVAALLEALIADRGLISMTGDVRVSLYAAFQRLWESAGGSVAGEMPADDAREAVAHARLSRLTPRSRQALLLTAVEGFSNEQAAQVLGVGVDEVAILVSDAVKALKEQTRSRVLIIEDEPIIAMDLEAIVQEMGHAVVEIADTKGGAVAAARRHQPDLVLADIQLADGSSGIDAVQEILGALSIPVIFITAYPDRLLTGSRPEPTFLIAKPFQPETVQAAVSQALFFDERMQPA